MNKTLIISIGVVVIIGLVALAYWLTGPVSQPTTVTNTSSGQNVGLPVVGQAGQNTTVTVPKTTATSTSVTTMLVAAANGGTVQTSNFINDSTTAKDPINPGYYYLGYHVNEGVPDTTATDTPPYVIEYISATQYFNIALLQEPIGSVREEAQQYLIARLGISQDQLCRLNYMVSVPNYVNSQFTGRNLGFSFCTGATVLPK